MSIKDIITSTPTPQVNLHQHQWSIFSDLWSSTHPQSSLTFTKQDDGWHITETIEHTQVFDIRRDYITLHRYTNTDLLGVLGMSLINPQESSCVITEGVSDFITTKYLLPSHNVLGITNLGGSSLAKRLLISLFTHIYIVADNDATGIRNAMNYRKFFSNYGISTTIETFPPCKDITEYLLRHFKLSTLTNI